MWFTTTTRRLQQFSTPLIKTITNRITANSQPIQRSFHFLTVPRIQPSFIINTLKLIGSNVQPAAATLVPSILQIQNSPQLMQSCGFKVKGRLRRRCKDCYFVVREGRMYNICKTHPRHKQMAMKKKDKNTWILTHAMQSKVRPY